MESVQKTLATESVQKTLCHGERAEYTYHGERTDDTYHGERTEDTYHGESTEDTYHGESTEDTYHGNDTRDVPKSKLIDDIFHKSKEFFSLPNEVKRKYLLQPGCYHGYCEYRKEAWVILGEEISDFQSTLDNFFEKCQQLAMRVLEIIARGFNAEDPLIFVKEHKYCGTTENKTALRLAWYPAIADGEDIKKDQVRCGEHSDYGSITLLLQDDLGGLQAQTQDGKFIDVHPIKDSIVVNVGALLQRWTADKLHSPVHRVVIPEKGRSSSRQSIPFFVFPDDMYEVKCMDGSDKYPPITADAYLHLRHDATSL
ncbi:uncharacterized protein LOC102806160 [Saccoglossus kowalevskii]|uniref:UPF0676 protein C1494.01-like n=1 Tax=Saccoglossus kowalevskii TaxID=10224 RepID=A0ABM0M7I9_SACKO|nr:PREDICTED: UPF0676 protein C1494.01-like [Saccoglossus kowalevskii]